ncbi:uncharacterized protein EAE98_011826 [Botrytis deweyae]|uniref:Uncharacterized protein n=1 Tax=Botrytis deweyae TaxID=2478750 RepID=A0ABQ7I559_9HELO|nr:uncharacterized protein EAE98_011826 [Botrytis deweyae]KAF7911883.1 hypothetical protein EAE98_011826 [Botrytis deweyae]
MEERELDERDGSNDYELMRRDEEEALEKIPIRPENGRWRRKWRIINPWIWIGFSIWSILTTRRLLIADFRYPICFLVLLQIAAYVGLGIFAVLTSFVDYFTSVPDLNPSRGPSFLQSLFVLTRYCLTVFISMVALIYNAEAIMLFNNLAVFATLLILTYAFDALLFSLAYDLRLLPRDQGFDRAIVVWALGIVCLASMIVYNDYRLNIESFQFAILGMFLVSLARTIAAIGYQVPSPRNPSYGASLYFMLWGGLPPCLLVTIFAAYRYEDFGEAFSVLRTWEFLTFVKNLTPGALTHILWNTPLRSTLALSIGSKSPYESTEENVPDAIDATVHLSLGLMLMSTFKEENTMNGFQIFVFMLIYLISLGPKEISLYIPKFVNFVYTIRRKSGIPARKLYSIWHKPILLWTTTILFTILSSMGILYWMDTISIRHNQKFWIGPKSPSLDTIYRAATKNRLQIVIAHSTGESIPAIKGIVTGILSSQPAVVAHKPDVLIYTKDPSEDIVKKIRAEVGFGDIFPLPNVGGPSGVFLHHILKNWDNLPTQTLFITTSQHTIDDFDLIGRRLFDYYNPAQLPPAAENSDILTGFLNLGELETCDCYGCYDKSGWNDTFRLIPSMWSASRPAGKDETPYRCQKVILTHGNNFIASAARIRGVGKDIWETLDDALSNPSLSRGWAHDRLKLGPEGRNSKMFGEKDSLEKPHLGYTVERLWGILLGCSNQKIAWRCPNLWKGWRRGGEKEDCACRD